MTKITDHHLLTDDALERMADEALGLDPVVYEDDSVDIAQASDDAFARMRRSNRRGMLAIANGHGYNPDDVRLLRRKKAFILALAETGVISQSAARAGWSPEAARHARKNDPEFANMWDNALEFAADVAESEALRRAVHGVTKDIYFEGTKIGTEVVYSDRLLELILKSRKPERFRESYKIDADVKGGVLVIPATPAIGDWEAQAAEGQEQYRTKRDDQLA